jgi:hypothetical protein
MPALLYPLGYRLSSDTGQNFTTVNCARTRGRTRCLPRFGIISLGGDRKENFVIRQERHRSQWKPSCGISQNMLEMVRFGDIQDAR